jgi:hypothetical protein
MSPFTKHTEGANITYLHRDFIVATIRGLMAAKLPHLTAVSAAAEWMPAVDHWALHDRASEIYSVGGGLDHLLCIVSQHAGDAKLAAQHARASLVRYQSPIRLLHAHSKLGEVLAVARSSGEDEDSTCR